MPQRPSKICGHPGCGARCEGRRCEKHAGDPSSAYDERRGSAASRGYDRRHEKWRLMILARDPLCQIQRLCGGGLDKPGGPQHLPAPSTVADHIKRVRDGGEWSLENGQGACALCHNWKTRMEAKVARRAISLRTAV